MQTCLLYGNYGFLLRIFCLITELRNILTYYVFFILQTTDIQKSISAQTLRTLTTKSHLSQASTSLLSKQTPLEV